MSSSSSILAPVWCVVPAAGVGARMKAGFPKQYLKLQHKTILEHTLERLLALPYVAGVVLALHPDDDYWTTLPISRDQRISCVDGAVERAGSVLNSLTWLEDNGHSDAWVLVHDAARPCVTSDTVANLIESVRRSDAVGGILGVPVSDTLKQVVNDNRITGTQDRSKLWQAQTPQFFSVGLLKRALQQALDVGLMVTDEASAMEFAGHQPLMVEGRADNIKVTRPEDLPLATFILQQQALERG
ncbi:2-C-methyl-D-erythritol 4-phosphate cytidylyltransferase [Cellvibrio japonicus]|nr:2-C-methyl-D-erythritol 4-phosphate cytidylyltransferase [Cellvibrio japonicus]QEI12659.1 2-C-methyl-D-erythritol 4-phosphate cytidylyltransferase [Cellvibrio japonicus]QEI16233.1 2-C-methyl-D-erythritol 4-phosphate cytidylyltransferase [Cellvibrio japonicus]QEI19811.1 2-C-methyl-D-erythritol 4-phosphate cytidylyltransferase [Cellvibrio japonicus]